MSNKIMYQDKPYGGSFSLNYFDGLNIGAITTFAGDTIPTGYLECDGREVSRATYHELFLVVGEKYGAGDGSTTFNLPSIIDYTAPTLKYLIKAVSGGEAINNATNTKKGFVRFATDDEALHSVSEVIAINAKQLKLAVPKTDEKNKVYGTDDDGKQILINVSELITKVITLPNANTGTLTAEELAILKDSRNNMLERNGITFSYTSTLDGKMRYSCINKYTDDKDYAYTVLVDETTGDWVFSYAQLFVNAYPDVGPTTIANPSGVSGSCFYIIKDGVIHICYDGVSVSSAGATYAFTNFPSQYRPKQGKQICGNAINFTDGYTNCFIYCTPSNLMMKAFRTGTQYWGNLVYKLGF